VTLLVGARNLRRDYRLGKDGEVVHAVRGVSVELESGDYLAIVGPSGSGK
jgi:putative ABC transport system ATP-binding protein